MQQLHAMARHNTEEALGAGWADAWSAWSVWLDTLQTRSLPVETDNRLQRWEWLLVGERLVKTDALDHHAGHDLVGCQDIAWDVVGAAVEFELDATTEEQLATGVAAQCGRPVDATLRRFLRPCYLAFQLGHGRMAEAASRDAADMARLRAESERYEAALRATLADERTRPPERVTG